MQLERSSRSGHEEGWREAGGQAAGLSGHWSTLMVARRWPVGGMSGCWSTLMVARRWPVGGSVRPLEYTDGGQEVARWPGVRPLEYTDGGQEVARRPGVRPPLGRWPGAQQTIR